MDGQPTRKRSKGDGVKNIASSSVEPEGVSGDEGRMEDSDFRNKDYFTPAVMVLPILLKQSRIALAPHDVFNCRHLNKQVKASVDDLLANERQLKFGYIRQDSWMLSDDETMQAFMKGTQDFKGNPFLTRRCEVSLDYVQNDQLSSGIDILRRFGCDLLRVELKLSLNSSPLRALSVLQRVFSYLPNVKRLEIECSEDEEEWETHQTNASHTPFPPLKALRRLKFSSYHLYDTSLSLGSLVRPILKAYGNQLTRLKFDDLFFRQEAWRSLHFPNLLELKVHFFPVLQCYDEVSKIYSNLAKLNCPNLEGFILCGDGMVVTAETFLTLNGFRGSLKTLKFTESLEEEIQPFELDPLDIQEFPQLTGLTLCVLDVENPIRHLFRIMFTKLQELRFKPSGESANAPPVPDENIRRSYFTIFPHLRQITWLQRWGMEPTVFTR